MVIYNKKFRKKNPSLKQFTQELGIWPYIYIIINTNLVNLYIFKKYISNFSG